MCDRLVELREGMARYAAGFDAAVLNVAQVEQVVRLAVAIEGVAATLKALAATRLVSVGSLRGGERSVAHHLARVGGTSVAEARGVVETGKRLEALPEVAGAARAGELSPRQSAVVADAAAADPGAKGRLLELAGRSSLAELREECARIKAAACPDLEARRRAIHEGRYLRSYTDAEGAWNLRMRHNPEVGAQVMAVLEPVRDRLFRQARSKDRR